jgi:hypothetical protein
VQNVFTPELLFALLLALALLFSGAPRPEREQMRAPKRVRH